MGLFDGVNRKSRGNSEGPTPMKLHRDGVMPTLVKGMKAEAMPEGIARSLKVKAGTKLPAIIVWPESFDYVKPDGETSALKYDAARQYVSRWVKANAGYVIVEGKMTDKAHDDDHAGILVVKVKA